MIERNITEREMLASALHLQLLTGEPTLRMSADVVQMLYDQLTRENEPTFGGWISVKDKLPMLIESVLFIGKNYHGGWFLAQRGYYDGTFWHSDSNGTVYTTTPVTHWMPLPEPPEE